MISKNIVLQLEIELVQITEYFPLNSKFTSRIADIAFAKGISDAVKLGDLVIALL